MLSHRSIIAPCPYLPSSVLQANHSSVKVFMLPYWAITVAPKATPDYFHRSDRISGPEAHACPGVQRSAQCFG